MRFLAVCASLALLASVPNSAKANFINGNELHDWCQSKGEGERTLCMGFVMGVVDMIQSGQKHSTLTSDTCFPDALKGGQVVDVAKKWLVDNPQHRHFVASDLVMVAMEQAFPCKK